MKRMRNVVLAVLLMIGLIRPALGKTAGEQAYDEPMSTGSN